MAVDPDPQAHVASTTDFYSLLNVAPSFNDSKELKSAYRKASIRYHPDRTVKQTSSEAEKAAARDKWDLFEVAHKLLSDAFLRAQYDTARNARELNRVRNDALASERRKMVDKLESRENRGMKRGVGDMVGVFGGRSEVEREEKRLAVEGAKMRRERDEREEAKRMQMEREEEEEERNRKYEEAEGSAAAKVRKTVKRAPGGPDLLQSTMARLRETARKKKEAAAAAAAKTEVQSEIQLG